MSVRTCLKKLYKTYSKAGLSKELGVSYQAIDKWYKKNEMPCSEYNGKTMYSKTIQKLTNGDITIKDLCGFVPPPQK